jgi:hypothetical protein
LGKAFSLRKKSTGPFLLGSGYIDAVSFDAVSFAPTLSKPTERARRAAGQSIKGPAS